jgi:hypothetical protein
MPPSGENEAQPARTRLTAATRGNLVIGRLLGLPRQSEADVEAEAIDPRRSACHGATHRFIKFMAQSI